MNKILTNRGQRPSVVPGLLVLVLVGLLSACDTTRNAAFVKVDGLVAQRDYDKAISELTAERTPPLYGDKDLVLKSLDLGVLQLQATRYAPSNGSLSEAERLIEDYYTKSVTSAAASFVANDNAIEYAGEPYEDLYLNFFKALNYAAMKDFDGAWVEVQRVNNKLNLLEDKYRKLADSLNSTPDAKGKVQAGKTEFYNSALAHWLSAVLYRADNQPDNAEIDLKKIDEAFLEEARIYNFPKPNLDGFLTDTGKARLSLVGLAGRGPFKKAHTYRLNTGRDMVAISRQDEDANGRMRVENMAALYIPGVRAGLNFKCQVPYVVAEPSDIRRAVVLVDGQPVGRLELLEDINQVAIETFKLRESIIYTKTIIRTVVKGVATKLAKDELNRRTNDGSIAAQLLNAAAGLAADVVVDASEQADLRSARFYPGQAWVGDFEIEAGEHKLTVQYFNSGGKLLYSDELGTRKIDQKGLNLWASWVAL